MLITFVISRECHEGKQNMGNKRHAFIKFILHILLKSRVLIITIPTL